MKKEIKNYIVITFGLLLVAIATHFFLVPHNLAAGGLTGLAMVINNYLPNFSVGIIMLIGNVFFFIIGFIFIGKGFGVKTIYASLMLSVLISLLEKIMPVTKPISEDILINLIFGILIGAIGMAIVFNRNASTGGTDIPAKILNKYAHIDIGKGLLIIDFIVTILAVIAFGATTGMYALLGVIINGSMVDFIIDGLNINKRIEIMSTHSEKIRKFIIEDLGKSATIYRAIGAYNMKESDVIVTVLGKKGFIKLKNFIKNEDPNAFIITHNVHEVLGEGFGDISE
ncbi:MAG: YitT family protein [Clostridium sp.]|uniref:YitT family protein n=1 Tax=Clostridium sp. TaxID=1506 RepID=UPI00305D7576